MNIRAFISYFEKQVSLNKEELNYLNTNIPVLDVPKNEMLLREGEISSKFFFVIKGCIRMFYVVDGMQKTTFFYTENDFVSSYESFTKQRPSKNNLQTLEPTQIAVISAEIAHQLLERFPKFEFLARIAMEEELTICQDIIASFITLNAEQRYLKLLNTQPKLLQRIPQYHLATYLGVSPETLSRIRKRIADKHIY